MRTQYVTLENKEKVIIGYHTKRKCTVCGKDIFTAIRNESQKILIELVGLAKWDIHECK